MAPDGLCLPLLEPTRVRPVWPVHQPGATVKKSGFQHPFLRTDFGGGGRTAKDMRLNAMAQLKTLSCQRLMAIAFRFDGAPLYGLTLLRWRELGIGWSVNEKIN